MCFRLIEALLSKALQSSKSEDERNAVLWQSCGAIATSEPLAVADCALCILNETFVPFPKSGSYRGHGFQPPERA